MRFVPVLCLLILVGCEVPQSHYYRPWLDDPRMDRIDELNDLKAEANLDSRQAQMQEFEGKGTMLVWFHALEGGVGWEYLRAYYTYENSTDRNFEWIRVWLEVLDPEGLVVSRVDELLYNPFGFELEPGDTMTDELKVPTLGVHHQAGWSWRIRCEPILMKVLPKIGSGQEKLR